MMSNNFNGWNFDSIEMHEKVKYIAVFRGDLDLTNAYALDSDEALDELLRDHVDDDRLLAVFKVSGAVKQITKQL